MSVLFLSHFQPSASVLATVQAVWALPLIAAILLLLNVTDGWKQGLVRKLWTLFAVLVSAIVTWFFGLSLLPLIHRLFSYPDLVMSALSHAAVFAGCFVLLCLIGSLKIAPTREYDSAPARFIIGSGGACIGLVTGILWLVLFALFLRHTGNIAENVLAHEEAAQQQVEGPQHNGLLYRSKLWGLSKVIWAAEALNQYPRFNVLLDTIDPIPAKSSRILTKSIRTLRDPEATERLMHHPEVVSLLQHPRLQRILRDEEVRELAAQRDLHGLLKHPLVIELLNDPDFRHELEQHDLEKILDQASAASFRTHSEG